MEVVALDTDKMMHETECLEKMYLAAAAAVAEAEEVDIAHTQVADSCSMDLGLPDRGVEEAGQAEDTDRKALQVYRTVRSSQRHWDRRERSVAGEEVEHMDHKQLRRSVAADIEYSVAGSGRIDAVAEAGVVDVEAEATMTGIAQGMVAEVDVVDDVADAQTEGELGSGEGVDVGADGERAREHDVGAEVVVHTWGVAEAGAGHSQGQQTGEAEGRWQWNGYGGHTSQAEPRAPEGSPSPIPQYSEG